jgi:LAO/AO transport system kinase
VTTLAAANAGERQALARLLRRVEDGDGLAAEACRKLFREGGRAATIGVTGPPGAGKSTLVDRIIVALRESGRTVAVLACDPSSPLTGGALLGDRARLGRHGLDPGVFVRSVATRGQVGGVSRHTFESVSALDAAGFDVVVVETVGTGQVDVDVTGMVDTTVLVTTPASGDHLQMSKAGVLEVADIVAVNKVDLPGGAEVAASLAAWLDAARRLRGGGWRIPVVATEARVGRGVADLVRALAAHRSYLVGSTAGRSDRVARWRSLVGRLVATRVRWEIERNWAAALDEAAGRIENRASDPGTEAAAISARWLAHGVPGDPTEPGVGAGAEREEGRKWQSQG